MTEEKRALVRAKIKFELQDYKSNKDRRHLAAIAEMMAEYLDIPDAGSEIADILLTQKTLPKLKDTVGLHRQLEDGLIRHFWKGWKGLRPNHEVYREIAKVLVQNQLPGWGMDDEGVEDRIRKRVEALKLK